MVELLSLIFRVFTAKISGVRKFRNLTVLIVFIGGTVREFYNEINEVISFCKRLMQ